MLVLTRKLEERITGYANVGELRKSIAGLPDSATVNLFNLVVSKFNGNIGAIRVKLGFDCPEVVRVVRDEVLAEGQHTEA